jgi:predicted tellurium resistance membrane protein TerC
MLDLLADPHAWAALVALSALEIVLGIDNIVFISVLVSRLPAAQATRARRLGLSLALVLRISLLFALTWLVGLSQPLFSIFGQSISWHDIILIGGGLFLIAKATHEMHAEIESAGGAEGEPVGSPAR